MKKFSVVLAAATALLAIAPAAAAHVCLNSSDIEGHDSPDGKTILFHMRDRSVWRNTVEGNCPGLRFHGFVWNLHGTNQVCEKEQALRVIGTGETCILGTFEKVSGPKNG
jgi:hypothetical protein